MMRPPLMIALAAALGATLWFSMQDEGVAEPVRRDARGAAASSRTPKLPARASGSHEETDANDQQRLLNGMQAWVARTKQLASPAVATASAWNSMRPPPPPPPKPEAMADAPPPPPVAPPFPHKWIGRFNDEPEQEAKASDKPVQRAVISGPSTTWVVKAGDVIEGQWRVDRIDNRTMNLTYLPLKLPQSVAMN